VPGWLRTVLILDAGQHAVLPNATWCYRRSSRHRRFRPALLQIPDAKISGDRAPGRQASARATRKGGGGPSDWWAAGLGRPRAGI